MNFVIFIIAAFLLYQCVADSADSCREYSDYTCDEIDKADYYVWFTFPDGDETYNIGRASGLSQCGSIASNYAYQKSVQNKSWGYVCCMITDESNCKEKHR